MRVKIKSVRPGEVLPYPLEDNTYTDSDFWVSSAPSVSGKKSKMVNPKRRGSLPLSLRVSVWLRDHKACHYCGMILPKPGNKGSAITQVDHIEPVSKGGSDELLNLVICCKRCNRAKANTSYENYINRELNRVTIQFAILTQHKIDLNAKSTNRTVPAASVRRTKGTVRKTKSAD